MVTYAYRCAVCGSVDINFPMGQAPTCADCPRCGAGVERRWTSPGLTRMHRGLRDAFAREERSRDEPEVVSRPHGGRRM
jgi:putative FmdB family regulatory protein